MKYCVNVITLLGLTAASVNAVGKQLRRSIMDFEDGITTSKDDAQQYASNSSKVCEVCNILGWLSFNDRSHSP